MPMTALQADADKRGILVYALRQSNTAPLAKDATGMAAPGPWGRVSGGYCAGLATRWIALRYAAYDYLFDRATKLCEYPDWKATADQNIIGDGYRDRTRRFPMQFQEAYAQYGLRLNLGAVVDAPQALDGKILRRAGEAAMGCHFIYIAREGGAHAVAMMNEGPLGWRFFDANFGHFRLADAPAFESFIDWFAQRSGYKRTYVKRVATVHINPPPFTGANFQSLMAQVRRSLGR